MDAYGYAHGYHYFLAGTQVWAGAGEAEILSCWGRYLGTWVGTWEHGSYPLWFSNWFLRNLLKNVNSGEGAV